MAPIRGRGGRGGQVRGRGQSRGGRGGRGGQRSGRVESRKTAFEAARIVEDEDINEPHGVSETEEESSVAEESSSDEDEGSNKPRTYNLLLQSFGQAQEDEGPSRKRRRTDASGDHVNGHKEPLSEDEDSSGKEEGVEEEVYEDEVAYNELEDDEDASDPYEAHFANPEENELSIKLKAVAANKWHTATKLKGSLHLEKEYPVYMPDIGLEYPTPSHTLPTAEALKFKKKLLSSAQILLPQLEGIQTSLASNLFAYRDVLFGARSTDTADVLRKLISLHALNLIFKTRDRVLKNSARLVKENANPDLEYRDQGFTRPKVLILLPTRQSCVRFVDAIIAVCDPEQQENKKKFEEGFGTPEDNPEDDQPEDYRELMEGNTDDMFRLGIKFTKKTLKFFSQFYNSDIIVASPLGLRRALDANDSKKQDYDFLSSMELVVLDQTDALLQQNWQHVEYIFEHLNLQPQEAHGCDFSRVRNWYLDGNAKYLRQTIVLSAHITPELKALFSNHMLNVAGKALYQPRYAGSMLNIGISIKQTFSRFTPKSPADDPDKRFNFFTTTVIPSITRYPKPPDGCLGVLVFIPSYFDFVRVRNYFANSSATQNISFGSISENSSPAKKEVRRARSHFLTGKHSVLLYTGRAHHFFRYKIRGVKKVVMYGLPDSPTYYKEIVGGFLGRSIMERKIGEQETGVRVLFSKYDSLKLERVVGSERVGRLLRDVGGDTFDFV